MIRLVVMFVVLSFCTTLNADLVLELRGTVTSSAFLPVEVGDEVLVRSVIDETTPDSDPTAYGEFFGADTSTQIFLGSDLSYEVAGGTFYVDARNPFLPNSGIFHESTEFVSGSGLPSGIEFWNSNFSNRTYVPASDTIPEGVSAMASEGTFFNIFFRDQATNDFFLVSGQVSGIPEPSTVALLSIATVGLVFRRRRAWS